MLPQNKQQLSINYAKCCFVLVKNKAAKVFLHYNKNPINCETFLLHNFGCSLWYLRIGEIERLTGLFAYHLFIVKTLYPRNTLLIVKFDNPQYLLSPIISHPATSQKEGQKLLHNYSTILIIMVKPSWYVLHYLCIFHIRKELCIYW